LNGFFEKYRRLDKKEIEEISKNVYIFKSREEYLNTLKRMLELYTIRSFRMSYEIL